VGHVGIDAIPARICSTLTLCMLSHICGWLQTFFGVNVRESLCAKPRLCSLPVPDIFLIAKSTAVL
jgi:hypothetical protein